MAGVWVSGRAGCGTRFAGVARFAVSDFAYLAREEAGDGRVMAALAPVRRPVPADAPAMAGIVNGWIDATPWMVRDLPPEEIEALMVKGMPVREIWVSGDPVEGYISVEVETAHIWGFYCARRGQGLGKHLLDQVKAGRDFLSLNTHVPNLAAQRFYIREGFRAVGEVEPGPASPLSELEARVPTGLRELRMEWRR
ncbi:MAG: GNAT family N-acetyltransferase [Rhodobacterales bacterium]